HRRQPVSLHRLPEHRRRGVGRRRRRGGDVMYPAEFAYVRPDGLDAVFTAVDEYADDAKVIAGGQSLLPLMKLRLATPAMLIDLAGAGELSGQHRTPSGVRLGAMTTYRELQHSPHTLGLLPGLGETVAVIADTQVRADRKSTRLNSSHVKISYA